MVNLGDEVKDEVTGFKGIAVSKHDYLQGCTRICVQPPTKKDGTMTKTETFDEPQLIIIKAKKIKRKALVLNPGGPEKDMPQSRSVETRSVETR